MLRVRLITPFHVGFQPRVLREADTLEAAGHHVEVVARSVDGELAAREEPLLRRRRWRLAQVDMRRDRAWSGRWLVASVRQRLARRAFAIRGGVELASRAYVKGYARLRRRALEPVSPNWIIAHTQAGLAVGAPAAERLGAALGFDCEDLLTESRDDPEELVRCIEGAYLPRCAYVSVPSRSLGRHLETMYGLARTLVLYNTFPLSLAHGLCAPVDRRPAVTLRLHWFGRTIGPGRGLEDAIRALAHVPAAELHLRGRIHSGDRACLERLAREVGAAARVRYLPLVGHDELIRTLADFDVGLAAEQPQVCARALTVSNKLFGYLLGGLAVAACATEGQLEVMGQIPAAGFTYAAGDVEGLARGLRSWVANPARLLEARQAAWRAARERFCWDREQSKLLAALEEGGDANAAAEALA